MTQCIGWTSPTVVGDDKGVWFSGDFNDIQKKAQQNWANIWLDPPKKGIGAGSDEK